MRHKMYSIIFLCTLLISFRCYAPALSITQPGFYTLGEDIIFASGVGDSIIAIESSDVTLDLGGRTIAQSGANSADGISIGSGFDRITIQNGRIFNVANRGIFVNTTAAAENIQILDITFDTCRQRCISFEGLFGSSNCVIKRCLLVNCDGLSGINFTNTTRTLEISDITISQRIGGASLTSYSLITASNIVGGIITNIRASDIDYAGFTLFSGTTLTGVTFRNLLAQNISSGGTTFTGITVTSFDGCTTSDLMFQKATVGTFTGIACSGSCTGSLFANCTYETISSGSYTGLSITGGATRCGFIGCISRAITSSLSATHITISSTSPGNLLIGCIAQGMSAGAASSFFNITSMSASFFIDCVVLGCSTSAGNCTPFNFTGASNCQLIQCYSTGNTATGGGVAQLNSFTFDVTSVACALRDCVASLNTATGGTTVSRGFFLNGSTEFVLQRNAAYRNIGALTSIGFTQGSATNAFIENTAIRNGTTVGNQFSAFAGTQANTVTIATVNSITQPFTNAGLV